MAIGTVLLTFAVILLVLLLLAACIAKQFIIVIHQGEGMAIERFGKFERVLTPGLNIVIPLLDQPRSFAWKRTYIGSDGSFHSDTTTNTLIDMRESVFSFVPLSMYTKDTVSISVNALMFYRVFDIQKAIYEVEDLQAAISNTAQTQLKEVFGSITFSEALQSQQTINDHLVREFGKTFTGWGIHVERMELLELNPTGDFSENLKQQMVSERQRRGEAIRADGRKTAVKLEAEGKATVSINLGIANEENLRKRSEGDSQAKMEIAQAESTSLSLVADAVKQDGASQGGFRLAQRYLDFMFRISNGPGHRIIYLPFDATSVMGSLNRLGPLFGNAKALTDGKGGKSKKSKSSSDFGDLN